MSIDKFDSGFEYAKFDESSIIEKLENDRKRAIKTGIKVIDDVLGAILPTDVLLVGAKTGTGKTEMVTRIAQYVAAQGKRPAMYALEAEKLEIELRQIYSEMAYLNRYEPMPVALNYKLWRIDHTRYGEVGDHLRARAIETLAKRTGKINLFYRTQEFRTRDFLKTAMAIKEETDIIIIDHIHYFDFEGKNENKELSDAIKSIRDLAQITGLPIILVAHLRKESPSVGGEYQKIIPTIDDFHGSSDLSKIATKGLLMAPGKYQYSSGIQHTLFQFPKFRNESQAKNYIFIGGYRMSTREYLGEYKIIEYKHNDQRIFQQIDNRQFINPESLDWLGQ